MSDTFLEIRSLEKSFGSERVLDSVSLNVKEGEFFSILGPSGCGKSTLLRILSGIETLDQGKVLFEGKSIDAVPSRLRPFHLVFQRYALFPHLNVFENVAFGLRVKEKLRRGNSTLIKQAVQEMLHLVKLEDFEKRSIQSLSGGQQQRVALARALVNRPRVLLLDEPMSALDEHLRAEMRWELQRLQKLLKMTFILVTHDQAEALSISDRIAVMNQGRIEQVGTAREIYEIPRTEFVARFVGDSNWREERIGQSKVNQMIRPERIQIKPLDLASIESNSEEICVRAKLTSAQFEGASMLLIFNEIETSSLKVRISSEEGRSLSIGNEFFLVWKKEDCHRFEVMP